MIHTSIRSWKQAKSKLFKVINDNKINENYPIVGDILNINDINYDIMHYFNRANVKLLVTMTDGKKIKTSVSKFYNDLVFPGEFPTNLNKKDILTVKIIE